MRLSELTARYEAALRPIFGGQLRLSDAEGGFVQITLDGERDSFSLVLYGAGHVRLYWCGECFIFDSRRDDLVSSDTWGEIVYEGKIDPQTLPQTVIPLIFQLKDCVYVDRQETVRGKTPSGYDEIRDYVIRARTSAPGKTAFCLANIALTFELAGSG